MARLYKAGVIGNNKPMYYTDEEVVQAYVQNPSMSVLAEELGMSFYSVRAALQRQGVEPLDNKRTKARNAMYHGVGTPQTVLAKNEF